MAKYSPQGSLLHAWQFSDGPAGGSGLAVAVAAQGNPVVAGTYGGSMFVEKLDGQTLQATYYNQFGSSAPGERGRDRRVWRRLPDRLVPRQLAEHRGDHADEGRGPGHLRVEARPRAPSAGGGAPRLSPARPTPATASRWTNPATCTSPVRSRTPSHRPASTSPRSTVRGNWRGTTTSGLAPQELARHRGRWVRLHLCRGDPGLRHSPTSPPAPSETARPLTDWTSSPCNWGRADNRPGRMPGKASECHIRVGAGLRPRSLFAYVTGSSQSPSNGSTTTGVVEAQFDNQGDLAANQGYGSAGQDDVGLRDCGRSGGQGRDGGRLYRDHVAGPRERHLGQARRVVAASGLQCRRARRHAQRTPARRSRSPSSVS